MNTPQQVSDGANRQVARAATVFKSILLATSGNIWTPASGKKFRLLAYMIEITGDATFAAAVAGGNTITLLDGGSGGASTGLTHNVYLPAAAPAVIPAQAYQSGWINLGALGILSAAKDNVLYASFGAALATGKARIRVAGTEEAV